jgi:hypothetical protein
MSGPSGEPSGALPGPPDVGRLEARTQARLTGRVRKQPLSAEQILARADAHRARAGGWPKVTCGAARSAAGETRRGTDEALRKGLRGLMARQVRRVRRSKVARVAPGGPGREHLAGRAQATRCFP